MKDSYSYFRQKCIDKRIRATPENIANEKIIEQEAYRAFSGFPELTEQEKDEIRQDIQNDQPDGNFGGTQAEE
jgi:hypothetical protein